VSVGLVNVDPLVDPRWLALTQAHGAGLFHSRPWLATLVEAYGFPIRAWIAVDATDTPVAGIVCCELDDLRGRRIVALPFTDAADPLGASPDAVAAVRARLEAAGQPLQLRLLDASWDGLAEGWTIAKRARWHRLAVAEDEDALWSRMSAAMRRAVRKAERDGVVVRPLDGEAGLDAFVAMHRTLRRSKYRLLAQPPAFFDAMRRSFAAVDGWHALGAYLDGKLVAATVYLRWRTRLYYKFNTSAHESLGARPNNLLVWSGIRLARALGCDTLDLGPSDDDQPGLIRFKRDTGAFESELRFLHWTPPAGADPKAAEGGRFLGAMTELLTAPGVPDEVVGRAGTLLYRYFA
jgi:CelD/BcsL family acetyltransferase involved in cellulose biosynthesis